MRSTDQSEILDPKCPEMKGAPQTFGVLDAYRRLHFPSSKAVSIIRFSNGLLRIGAVKIRPSFHAIVLGTFNARFGAFPKVGVIIIIILIMDLIPIIHFRCRFSFTIQLLGSHG